VLEIKIYLIFKLMTEYRETLYNEVLKLVSKLKAIDPGRLSGPKGLWENGMDIVDIVDIILAIEKKYKVVIPDEVPVYTIDDLVNFLQLRIAR
jgi:acyl carrier protein